MRREDDAEHWPIAARWGVAAAVYLAGCLFVPDPGQTGWLPAGILLLAVAVFWLLKLKAARERKHRIDAAELRAGLRQ
jgi:hypothetical protein